MKRTRIPPLLGTLSIVLAAACAPAATTGGPGVAA